MEKIWFICSSKDKKVSGPFTDDEVKSMHTSGQVTDECHIWWKGQKEWLAVNTWLSHSNQIVKNENSKEKNAVWYVDLGGGQPVGPLTQNELIDTLKGVSKLAKIRLWTVGIEKWTSIFEFSDVMDQLGMSRREHERVPLMGAVAVSRPGDNSTPTMMRAVTISVSGLGLMDARSLNKGEEVYVLIKSPEFSAPIRTRAMTVYVTPSGHAGLKFAQLQPEVQSIIFDYVRKFSASQSKAA